MHWQWRCSDDKDADDVEEDDDDRGHNELYTGWKHTSQLPTCNSDGGIVIANNGFKEM